MKKLWIGLTIGALVAGIAVSLIAPQTGRSTRRKLRRSLEDFGDTLSEAAEYLREQAEHLAKETQDLAGSGKPRLDDAIDAVQNYARSAGSEVIKSTSRLM